MLYPLTNSPGILNLELTLPAGQVFCWEKDPNTNEWFGVMHDIAYWLSQDEQGCVSFRYASDNSSISPEDAKRKLHEFFQLEIDLQSLVSDWSRGCPQFEKIIADSVFRNGLRICRQAPFECLISFIVSANNHIKRIGSNLKSIRTKYGSLIASSGEWNLYTFPTVDQLATATEEQLRDLGLGYRAGYIVKTCQQLIIARQLPDSTQLEFLRKETDIGIARNFLMYLAGVGRKVADCVCLYSLDFPSVAPVDTHMFQIAQRLFESVPKDKYMHETIQRLMIERFGEKAGWAHCFLFAAHLPSLTRAALSPSQDKRIRVRE